MRTTDEFVAIANGDEVAGGFVHDEVAIAGNVGRDHGNSGGHGLQNRVRLPFVFAAEPEHVEMR